MFLGIKRWGQRYLSDPQAILLIALLTSGLLLLIWMGKILAPVIASIVIAYLLQWFVKKLIVLKVPFLASVLIVYTAFLSFFLGAIFILWPIIWDQLLGLFEEFPSMVSSFQHYLYLLPQQFPEFLTKETIDGWVAGFLVQLKNSGKTLFTLSLSSLPNVVALVIYIVLVPFMVFFFLKDYKSILAWFKGFLPTNRELLAKIWHDVHHQIGNYIRGKGAEVIIISIALFLLFYSFQMRYATLLAVLAGLSVLIPYIGAAIVTIPIVLVAFFQWGIGPHFAYLLIAYGIIMTVDGIVLVPLLFSEAVSMHPLVIIIAVLVFGGWWGFWGVFFAIPLATVVRAVLERWPRREIV